MKGLTIFALAACAGCLTLSASAGTVVFSDNFSGNNLGLGQTSISQWNVVAGNVDVIGNNGTNASYDFYAGNGTYLDLDGTGQPSNAKIETVASFGPGTYTLTFDLGNNPGGGASNNTLAILLGTTQIGTLTTTGFPALGQESFTFYSATGGHLSFEQGGSPDQQGSILDNVQLVAQTPEPGTFAILGVGLIGLGLLRRRIKA